MTTRAVHFVRLYMRVVFGKTFYDCISVSSWAQTTIWRSMHQYSIWLPRFYYGCIRCQGLYVLCRLESLYRIVMVVNLLLSLDVMVVKQLHCCWSNETSTILRCISLVGSLNRRFTVIFRFIELNKFGKWLEFQNLILLIRSFFWQQSYLITMKHLHSWI